TTVSVEYFYPNDYHCRVVHFLEILQKKYCAADIYKDVLSFTNESNFRIDIANEDGYGVNGVKYTLHIGDYTYDFADWGFSGDFDKLALPEIILNQIRNSFMYRYVTEQKNKFFPLIQ